MHKIIKASFVILMIFSLKAFSNANIVNLTTRGAISTATWKEIGGKDIEKQNLDDSCGLAAVATILRSFYGEDIYERDVLDEVLKVSDGGAASFSDLEKVVKKFGFKAGGFRMSFADLKGIKIPGIVYLRYRGQDHFSVIRGINEQGLVWLGDPLWGNRKFSKWQFKSMWETRDDDILKGSILLIVPENKSLAQMHSDFFIPPETNTIAIQLLTLRR